VLLGALAVALVLGAASAAADPTLPAGFQIVPLANNFGPPGDDSIMDVAWAPDGRMFAADRGGYVFVHMPGDAANVNELVADIHGHVNSAATTDHGLLGIATDKDFESNGYLYLLYTYDDTDTGATGRKVSVLTRITVGSDNKAVGGSGTNGVTDPTETVLLGKKLNTTGAGADGSCGPPSNTNDCIPSEGSSHSIGSVRVAPDGTLFVGTGDGNDYTKVDPLAFNDNNPQTYRGKIMHIDREGHGLPGHPFCPADTNPADVCTKIYAMGLRNPFRFTVRPEGGLAIGDVGQNAWEELDLANGGEDFGWPCWEGNVETPFEDGAMMTYKDSPFCKARYANPAATGPAPTFPAWSWFHVNYPVDLSKCTNTVGNTSIGGPEYMGDQYPAGYRGTIFFGDWTCQWINHATLSGNTVTGVNLFASGWNGGIDLLSAPDGNLAYIDNTGVNEVVYGPGNHKPQVTASGTTDAAPLTADFSSTASDPDGDSLNYDWDFGDGSPHGTTANPTHVYASPGLHIANVTVDDGRGMSASASATVTVTPAPAGGVEGTKTRLHLARLRLSVSSARLGSGGSISGSFSSAHSVRKLVVSLWRGRANATACRWWSARSHSLKKGSCKQPHWLTAKLHRKGTRYTWTLKLGKSLPRGSYTLVLQALPRGSGIAPSARLHKTLRAR
jgi:glucose/arabinose dehydrogenase